MKKIIKFLNESGWKVRFIDSNICKNIGGKGWNNNGTYQINIYEISKGDNKLIISDKITGRPEYMLWAIVDNVNMGTPLIFRRSQNDFIFAFKYIMESTRKEIK